MTPRSLRALLAAVALAVLAAGCGSGASTTTVTSARLPGSGSSTASEPASVVPNRQADGALARAALVRLSDLAAGWTSRPDDANDFHCPAVEAAEAHPHAKSSRFNAPAGAGAAQHEVIVLADEDAANAALDALVSQETLDCFARQGEASVRRQVNAGTEVGHVTAARLANLSPSGDRAAGVRLTYPVSANGVDATAYEDLVFTRVGRGLSLFASVSQGAAPDVMLTAQLARLGAQRLRDALGSA
jgi:hypothetical protein